MAEHEWVREFPGAVIVCDETGTIVEMNDRAVLNYEASGGRALIGKGLLDCHPEQARTKLAALMDGRRINVYTIEKNGLRKLIYQAPWFRDGRYAGFVEIAFEIPADIPHFVRS
jgi:transcriptional regulator with PAS, ATPase and Fis domain